MSPTLQRGHSVPLIRRPHPLVFLMLVPSIAMILIFNYIPIIQSVFYSFFEWSGGAAKTFVGLGNYLSLFRDPLFLKSLVNQGILLVARIFLVLVPPLFVALLIFGLKTRVFASNFFRMLFVVPVVIPPVVILLLWRFIYDGEIGLLNALLDSLGLGNLTRGWLADPDTALGAVIAMGFPWVDGTNMLIFLAGLLAVDSGIWDSLDLEGVKPIRRFFSIEIHLISGQLRLLLVLSTIRLLQDFVGVMILTNGGPGAETLVPALYLYKNAFGYGKMGYANAIGVAMFVIILLLSILNSRFKEDSDA